jgi:hypothetical protein
MSALTCGCDPEACWVCEVHQVRITGVPDEEEEELLQLNAIKNAAYAWWNGKRPESYTIDVHRINPTVNCVTDAEKQLATSISSYGEKTK